jgi:Carboxypeptidase regulatory-like domain/TonB-dependent Receptor Plug Domain
MVRQQRVVRDTTDESGRYQLCGVPTDVSVLLRTLRKGQEGPPLELKLDNRVVAVRRIRWDGGGTNGTARVTGTVTGNTGAPLANATVLVLGTKYVTRTSDDGAFRLDSLPAGSYTLEARAIGYGRQRTQLELAPGLDARASLVLKQVAVKLPDLTVSGRGRAFGGSGFDERRLRAVGGHFITRAEIQRRGSVRTEDLFRGIAGIEIEPIGGTDYQILSLRGGGGFSAVCAPTVLIDRVIVPLDPETTGGALPLVPEEIQGIEIYQNANDAPVEYRRIGETCGVILVWTRRGTDR